MRLPRPAKKEGNETTMGKIYMRFPQGRAKALTLSYDDGVEQDIRLISILRKNGLKGTFNLNSGLYAPDGFRYPAGDVHRVMSARQARELYLDSGMEVAVHALTHPDLTLLPQNICTREILRDRENLERQFGCIVRGMAYPYGTYNDAVVDVLRQCGIVYARTVHSTEGFALPQDWLRLCATCHHGNPRLMELARKFTEAAPMRAPILFYLWGHSYEFEQQDNWDVIEVFSEYMSRRDDIWYATNLEIYEYIEDFHRLVFSMDETIVQNPTNRDLFFLYGDTLVTAKPGTTVLPQP